MGTFGMNFKTDNGCPAYAVACELFKRFIKRIVGMDDEDIFIHGFHDFALIALFGRYTLNVGNGEYTLQTAVFAHDRGTAYLATCQHGLCLSYCLLR